MLCESCRFVSTSHKKIIPNWAWFVNPPGVRSKKKRTSRRPFLFFLRVGLRPTRRYRVRPVGEHIRSRDPQKKKDAGERAAAERKAGASFRKERRPRKRYGPWRFCRKSGAGFPDFRDPASGTGKPTGTNESRPAGRSETATARKARTPAGHKEWRFGFSPGLTRKKGRTETEPERNKTPAGAF